MVVMEGPSSSRPPQISEMFQKFALAFKTKTFELFAEEEDDPTTTSSSAPAAADADVFTLLDSAEEFIPDQKVVVIKPDPTCLPKISRTQFTETLISSIFATVSSFEASYLNFQTAHVPKVDQNALEAADKALVSNLQKLTDMKNVYKDFRKNPCGNFELPVGSLLEFQVQENQSKLRTLETMVNQLISDIEHKDDQVLFLRKKLDQALILNSNLSKKLGLRNGTLNKGGMEVLLTVRVFESILRDCVKSLRLFTKILIDLMRKAMWDLEIAANSVFSGVHYSKKGHYKYAYLSYVCLGMLRGFDFDDFGLHQNGTISNGSGSSPCNGSLKQLIEHVSCNPMEILAKNPTCDFARFCEQKYEQLVHPTMESSIFSSFEGKEVVLDSWKSLGLFYESFIRMASSVWLLHKLAYSFDPIVEIFQVERGVDFNMVYMEDVTRKDVAAAKTRPKVAYTVVPGFKVGSAIIQSQVYLTGTNCRE